MRVEEIGTRGLLFTFSPGIKLWNNPEALTFNIYVIKGKKHIFICDTGLNTNQLEKMNEYFKENNLDKYPTVIFNTHSHQDHIAGNVVLEYETILSHRLCRENIDRFIKQMKEQKTTEFENKAFITPTLTFDKKFVFEEENIEFFHSPGHTEDSASCYDRTDKVLVVGDNLLPPFPLTSWGNIDEYIETLNLYDKMDISKIVPGHNKTFDDKKFIAQTRNYLEQLKAIDVNTKDFNPVQAYFLRWSIVSLAYLENAQENHDRVVKYGAYLQQLLEDPITAPDNQDDMQYMSKFAQSILEEKKE